MRQSKQLFVAVVALFIVLGLSGCDKQEQPDFSGYKKIADLATIDCTFHNVAEIYNDGTDIIFGINVGYKKAWFEYDGSVELGVDVSQVRIEGPDASNVVTVFVPEAQVLGIPQIDETSFSEQWIKVSRFKRLSRKWCRLWRTAPSSWSAPGRERRHCSHNM